MDVVLVVKESAEFSLSNFFLDLNCENLLLDS